MDRGPGTPVAGPLDADVRRRRVQPVRHARRRPRDVAVAADVRDAPGPRRRPGRRRRPRRGCRGRRSRASRTCSCRATSALRLRPLNTVTTSRTASRRICCAASGCVVERPVVVEKPNRQFRLRCGRRFRRAIPFDEAADRAIRRAARAGMHRGVLLDEVVAVPLEDLRDEQSAPGDARAGGAREVPSRRLVELPIEVRAGVGLARARADSFSRRNSRPCARGRRRTRAAGCGARCRRA